MTWHFQHGLPWCLDRISILITYGLLKWQQLPSTWCRGIEIHHICDACQCQMKCLHHRVMEPSWLSKSVWWDVQCKFHPALCILQEVHIWVNDKKGNLMLNWQFRFDEFWMKWIKPASRFGMTHPPKWPSVVISSYPIVMLSTTESDSKYCFQRKEVYLDR